MSRGALVRKRRPYPFGLDYIEADLWARFFHCSTFTPLISAHNTHAEQPLGSHNIIGCRRGVSGRNENGGDIQHAEGSDHSDQ